MKLMTLLTVAVFSASAALGADKSVLVDVTAKAGIEFRHSIGDDEMSNIVESTGAGCAFLDFDGDGNLDIYLVNGRYHSEINHARGRKMAGKLGNALYRNNGDGTFTDVTVKAGVGDQGYGMACVAADYDNDGDTDLFITNYGPDVLYRNNGDGTFTDVTKKAGVAGDAWSVGSSFFDYDQDGWVDLFVAGYLVFDPDYRYYYPADGFPGPLSYQGEFDHLYRNRGDGTFEDVTKRAGLLTSKGRGMGLAACDADDDGDEDLYIANDGMENYFYQNQGDGTFVNTALDTGTAFGQNGEATSAMGPEFGDYDLDGKMDLLVPDMGYGCLYRNSGKGYYEEKSAQAGLAATLGQYTSWSGNFFDFDNDGWLDIFIVNGDAHHLEPEEDTLFLNQSGKKFIDESSSFGKDFQAKFVGRGSATGDFDNDGDLDILVLNINDRPRLLRNDGGGEDHWIMLKLEGTESNRSAIGARIRMTAAGRIQTRDVRSSSGYLSQSDLRVHFGLGDAIKADRIEIRWPSGLVQVLEDVASDQVVSIKEPPRKNQVESKK